MEEKDILELEKLGYKYDRVNGFILDSNGEYSENVVRGDKTWNSKMKRPAYDAWSFNQKELEYQGYGPVNKPITDWERKADEEDFKNRQKLKNFTGYVKDEFALQQVNEEQGTDYIDLDDYYNRGVVKNNNLNKYEKKFIQQRHKESNGDAIDKYLSSKAEQEKYNKKGVYDGKDQLEEFKKGDKVRPGSSLLIPDFIEKPIQNIEASVLSWFLNDGDGIDEEKTVDTENGRVSLKDAYANAKRKQEEAFKPFAKEQAAEKEKYVDELVTKIDKLKEKGVGELDKEMLYLRDAKRIAIRSANELKDHAEGNYIDRNIATRDTALDFLTLGTQDLAFAGVRYKAMSQLKDIVEKGENLNDYPELKEYLESIVDSDAVGQLNLSQSKMRGITGGTVESLKFLVEMALSGGINSVAVKGAARVGLKASTAGISKGLAKGLKTVVSGNSKALKMAKDIANPHGISTVADLGIAVNKGLIGTKNMITSSALTPMTYTGALSDYNGTVVMQESPDGGMPKMVTSRSNHKQLSATYDMEINALKKAISEESDPQLKAEMELALTQNIEAKTKLEAPRTLPQAFAKSYTSTLLEKVSESVVGPVAGYLGGSVMKGINKIPGAGKASKFLKLDKVQELYAQIEAKRNAFSEKSYFNEFVDKQIQNPIPEGLEEIAISLMPTPYETDTEADQRLKELTTLDYYVNVFGTTLLQKGVMDLGGTGLSIPKTITRNTKFSEERKNLKRLLKDLESKSDTDPEAKKLLLELSAGTEYSAADYDIAAEELRNKGDEVGAAKIEGTKYQNQALEAQRYGMLGSYIKGLENAAKNPKSSPESKTALAEALVYAKEIKSLEGNYQNPTEIAFIKARRKSNAEKATALEGKLNENSEVFEESWENYRKANDIEETSLQDYTRSFSDSELLSEAMQNLAKHDPTLADRMRSESNLSNHIEIGKYLTKQELEVSSLSHQDQLSRTAAAKVKAVEGVEALEIKANTLKTYIEALKKSPQMKGLKKPYRNQVIVAAVQAYGNKASVIAAKTAAENKAKLDKMSADLDAEIQRTVNPDSDAASTVETPTDAPIAPTTDEAPMPELTPVQEAAFKYLTETARTIEQPELVDDLPAGELPNNIELLIDLLEMVPDATFEEIIDNLREVGLDSPTKLNLATMYREYRAIKGIKKSPSDKDLIDKIFAEQQDSNFDEPAKAPSTTFSPISTKQNKTGFEEIEVEPTDTQEPVETPPLLPTLPAPPVEPKLSFEEQLKREAQNIVDTAAEVENEKDAIHTTVGFSNYKTIIVDDEYIDIAENDNNPVDSRIFSDPTKMGVGTVLNLSAAERGEWDAVRVSNGTTKSTMTFREWYDAKLEKFEGTASEFEATDEFRNKVPIFYTYGGKRVGFVHDTDWYDKRLERGKDVDIFGGARESAISLRNRFLNNTITQVEIASRGGSERNLVMRTDNQITAFKAQGNGTTGAKGIKVAVLSGGAKGGAYDPTTGKVIEAEFINNYNFLADSIEAEKKDPSGQKAIRNIVLYPSHTDNLGKMHYTFARIMTLDENGNPGETAYNKNDHLAARKLWTAMKLLSKDKATNSKGLIKAMAEMSIEEAKQIAQALEDTNDGLYDLQEKSVATIAKNMFGLKPAGKNYPIFFGKGNAKLYEELLFDDTATPVANIGREGVALIYEMQKDGTPKITGVTTREQYQNEHLATRFGNKVQTIIAGGVATSNVQPLIRVVPKRDSKPAAPKPLTFSSNVIADTPNKKPNSTDRPSIPDGYSILEKDGTYDVQGPDGVIAEYRGSYQEAVDVVEKDVNSRIDELNKEREKIKTNIQKKDPDDFIYKTEYYKVVYKGINYNAETKEEVIEDIDNDYDIKIAALKKSTNTNKNNTSKSNINNINVDPNFNQQLAEEIQEILAELYPEITPTITANPEWAKGDNVLNQKDYKNRIKYNLKVAKALQSLITSKENKRTRKYGEIAGIERLTLRLNTKERPNLEKNIRKTLRSKGATDTQIDLVFDYMRSNNLKEVSVQDVITSLLAKNSFVVEVNTAKDVQFKDTQYMQPWELDEYGNTEETTESNTSHYSRLSAPGNRGKNKYEDDPNWEYQEIEFHTPDITPNIKGHAEFSTDNGIGWARIWYNKKTGAVEVQEVQSDLFQKGRDSKELSKKEKSFDYIDSNFKTFKSDYGFEIAKDNEGWYRKDDLDRLDNKEVESIFNYSPTNTTATKENEFLQLLNKKGNWVNFFIQSIVQDSVKKGYGKVLFPTGETAARVEGHQTIADELKSYNTQIKREEDKLKQTVEKLNIPLTEEEKVFGSVEKNKLLSNKENAENYIKELKNKKEELKTQGLEKLKPIEAFYTNRVTNILNKLYDVKEVTDEFGNTWNEINVNSPKVLSEILLQKDEADRIIGQANIKALTVLIDALNQKQDTLAHEYAHHYISWYRDSPIVQEAIKKWGGSEEALVQSIGEQTVKQKGKAYEWWKKFEKWLLNKFNNLKDLEKEQLTKILTDAFLTRTDLNDPSLLDRFQTAAEQGKKEVGSGTNTPTPKNADAVLEAIKKKLAEFGITDPRMPMMGISKRNKLSALKVHERHVVVNELLSRIAYAMETGDANSDENFNAESKTGQNNVVINPLYQKAGKDYADSVGGVFTLRLNNTKKHFGNPFTGSGKTGQGVVKSFPTIAQAVTAYEEWLTTDKYDQEFKELAERKKWILSQIKSGKLKDKPLIYYKELGELSHANILDKLINSSPTRQVLDDYEIQMAEIKQSLLDTIKTIEDLQESNPTANLDSIPNVEALQAYVAKVDNILDNIGEVEKQALDIMKEEGFVGDQFDEFGIIKDFYSSSAEDNHSKKMAPAIKKVFASISTNKTGFLGLPDRPSYMDIHKALLTIMSKEPFIDNSFDAMINRIREIHKANAELDWLGGVADALEMTTLEVQRAFVVNMYKFPMNGTMTTYKTTKNGELKVSIFDITEGSGKNKIKNSWLNNFSARLGDGNLTKKKAQDLLVKYNKLDKSVKGNAEVRKWLKSVGIEVSDLTWFQLVEDGLKSKDGSSVAYEKLFEETGFQMMSTIRRFLANVVKNIPEGESVPIDSDMAFVPHTADVSKSALNKLIAMEAQNDPTISTTMTRDGELTVSNSQYSNLFYNTYKELMEGKIERDFFTENSFLMDAVYGEDFDDETKDAIRSEIKYGQSALQSLKNLDTNTGGESIDKLADSDREKLHMYMFQNMAGPGTVPEALKRRAKGLKLRYATLPTPTASDKGKMMTMVVPVLNLMEDSTNISFDGEGNVEFSNKLKNHIFDRLVLPELNRIVNTKNKKYNINAFDAGKGRFNLIPELNHLGDGLESYLEKVKNLTPAEAIKIFKADHFDDAFNAVMKDILPKNVEAGFKNNSEYIGKAKERTDNIGENQIAYLAKLDHRLNYAMHQMDMIGIFAGDPALYAKRVDDSTFENSIKSSDSLGINLSKRLAALIAPGNVMANSQNKFYKQIHLKDTSAVSNVFEEIVANYPDLKITKNDAKIIKAVRDGSVDKKSDKYEAFAKKYDRVLPYMDIETTDAQEYTTLAEHLQVMIGMGKLSNKKYDEIIEKVYVKKEALDPSDVFLILQPTKPVYTGFEMRDGIRVLNYIKSSSVPLLPWIHGNTSLGPLMEKMMEIEVNSNMTTTVRASYLTANKVGHVSQENAIDPMKEEDVDTISAELGAISKAIVDLPRRNFREQQTNPYHGGEEGTHTISMGTQIMKILFGNGMADETFEDGVTGRQLLKQFDDLFGRLTAENIKDLEDKLGEEPTTESLSTAIMGSLEASGDLTEDIREILDPKNSTSDGRDFMIPLWAISSGEKIESVLNAFINNTVLRSKAPGNSFVVSSSQGLDTIDRGYSSKIIKVDPSFTGKLKEGEIIIPSRIQVGGQNVDLYEKKDGEYVWLTGEEGALSLNMDKFDPEIFKQFGYRTPTSSHTTGAAIKVVAILPPHVGDQGISSPDLIVQMGQDHDNDKLNIYHPSTVLVDGRIEILSDANKEHWDSDASKMSVEKALIYNELLNIYKKIYYTSNKKVQAKIKEPLSTAVAENQVKEVLKFRGGAKTESINVLSFEYQDKKMKEGAAGSAAIGIYAKSLTMLSRIQQLPKEIRPFVISVPIVINGKKIKRDFTELKSKIRSIAKIIDERVNLATDNAKLGVLGLAGLTDLKAVGVDAYLSILGVDQYTGTNQETGKDDIERSVSFMLHTHPVIQNLYTAYTEAKNLDASKTTTFKDAVEEKMTEILGSKKGYESWVKERSKLEAPEIDLSKEVLENPNLSKDATLDLMWNYYLLSKQASEFTKLTIGADFDNLGANLHETMQTVGNYNDVKNNNNEILGVSSLIGDEESFTAMGHMLDAGTRMANKYLFKFHPYKKETFSSFIFAVGGASSEGMTAKEKTIVKKAMVKYFHASTAGLTTMTATQKAKDLFHKSWGDKNLGTYTTNETLASYLQRVKAMNEPNAFENNLFIKNLTRKSKKNTKHPIDLLTMQDSMGNDAFEDEALRESVQELWARDEPLPRKNGKPYTTKMFVKDLFLHNTLSGATSKSIGTFHHLLPVELYNFGLAKEIRNGVNTHNRREFAVEFIRHNPNWGSIKKAGRGFQNTATGGIVKRPQKLSGQYHNFLKDNFGNLYHLVDASTGEYARIMPKIDDGRDHYRSDTYSYKSKMEAAPKEDSNSVKKSGIETLANFIASDTLSQRAKNYAKFLMGILPQDYTILESGDESRPKYGQYAHKTDTVTYYPRFIKTRFNNDKSYEENLSSTIMHETVHFLTSKMIEKYEDGSAVPPKEYEVMKDLFAVYRQEMINLEGYNEYRVKQTQRNAEIAQDGKSSVSFTNYEKEYFYPTSNMKEFIAAALDPNNRMIQVMQNVDNRKANKTWTQELKEALVNLINKIITSYNNGTPAKDESYVSQFVNGTMEFIDVAAKEKYKLQEAERAEKEAAENVNEANRNVQRGFTDAEEAAANEQGFSLYGTANFDELPITQSWIDDIVSTIEKELLDSQAPMSRKAATDIVNKINKVARGRIAVSQPIDDLMARVNVRDLTEYVAYARLLEDKLGMTPKEWDDLSPDQKDTARKQVNC